jgi:hypothetical protein
VAAIVTVLIFACGRSDVPPARDSARPIAGASTSAARGSANWLPELGAALLVPSDSDSSAILLYPDDVADLRRDAVTVVDAAGDTSAARVDTASDQQCGDAPIVRIAGAPSSWSAGFVGLSAPPVRMDSIESLAPRDSARLATDIARLASGIPTAATSDFRGLPFAVAAAHQLHWRDHDVLLAHLVRRLNQEASPREERTLLIAERAASQTPFAVVFSQRSEGSEETAEHFDVLAALRVGDSLVILIARDQDARTQYDLLERTAAAGWRTRWSRKVGC